MLGDTEEVLGSHGLKPEKLGAGEQQPALTPRAQAIQGLWWADANDTINREAKYLKSI